MKPKIFSLFLAVFISSNINAQLKVFQNGNSVFGLSSAEQASDIRGHQCLMQHFMTSKNGAAAYLGATENSYTEANHVFDQLLFDEILNKGIYNLGDVNIQSHILNMAKSNLYYAKENAFCYLCGGDPTLEIFTQPTKIFRDLSISFDDNKIKINVPDLKEYSVSVVVNDKNLYTKHTSES